MKRCSLFGRSWLLCAPMVAATLVASLNSAAVNAQGSSPVTVHQHVNFSGRELSVGAGDVSIRTLRGSVGNDRISSIEIEPGYTVLACQHSRLRGRCETFTGNVSDLRTIGFNDVISSLRVTRTESLPPVIAYQNVGFGGRSLEIDEPGTFTITDLRRSGLGNDVISSFRIADGYEVIACEHSRDGGSGRCEIFTSSISDLRTIRFNDTISRLDVTRISDDTPVNRVPTADDVELATLANVSIEFTLQLLIDASNDPDGDALEIEVALGNGLTQDGDTFTYDPPPQFGDLAAGELGTVSFDYTVTDIAGQSAEAQINITVEGVVPTGPAEFSIGDIGPGGGVVFSVSEDGLSGLEFAQEVLGPLAWGCVGIDLDGINNLDGFTNGQPNQPVQSGLNNSDAFAECNSPAADAALGFSTSPSVDAEADGIEFDDWYLPSIVELLEIVNQSLAIPTVLNQFGDSVTPGLWSSTENTDDNAWSLQSNGEPGPTNKNVASFHVLPVRSF